MTAISHSSTIRPFTLRQTFNIAQPGLESNRVHEIATPSRRQSEGKCEIPCALFRTEQYLPNRGIRFTLPHPHKKGWGNIALLFDLLHWPSLLACSFALRWLKTNRFRKNMIHGPGLQILNETHIIFLAIPYHGNGPDPSPPPPWKQFLL